VHLLYESVEFICPEDVVSSDGLLRVFPLSWHHEHTGDAVVGHVHEDVIFRARVEDFTVGHLGVSEHSTEEVGFVDVLATVVDLLRVV